jgi:hypothetical protein
MKTVEQPISRLEGRLAPAIGQEIIPPRVARALVRAASAIVSAPGAPERRVRMRASYRASYDVTETL